MAGSRLSSVCRRRGTRGGSWISNAFDEVYNDKWPQSGWASLGQAQAADVGHGMVVCSRRYSIRWTSFRTFSSRQADSVWPGLAKRVKALGSRFPNRITPHLLGC
jgi:hypothetical protein